MVARVGAVVVEREHERLEPERDPHTHEEVRCLLFFFFFLFVCLKKATLQRNVAKPFSYFLVATQEKTEEGDGNKKAVVAFLLLFCCAILFLC